MHADEVVTFIAETIRPNFPVVDSRGKSLVGPEVVGSYQRVLRTFTPSQARRGVERLLDMAERPWTRPPTARQVQDSAVAVTGPGRDVASLRGRGKPGHRGPHRHCCVCNSGAVLQPFLLSSGETANLCRVCYEAICAGGIPEPVWSALPLNQPFEADEPAGELDAIL